MPAFAGNSFEAVNGNVPFFTAQELQAAGDGDFAFCEFADPAAYKDKIEELIVYNWNRHYPADTKCTLELKEFRKVAERDFAGKSHEKVTELIYYADCQGSCQ